MAYLEMEGITKRFPGVVANDDVDFSVEKGSIHALLGENGAGKSTLVLVLYGMHEPDSGRIILKGREVSIPDPQTAIDLGIGLVHQEFQLVPSLSVAHNVALGREPTRGIWIDRQRLRDQIRDLTDEMGVSVDPSARIIDLSVGEQQRVEVLKLLYRQAELLILDEPTTVLTPQETEGLFAVLERLRDEGHPIIYITHKLEEVMEISDTATVLRDGRVIDVVDVSASSKEELARLMVGREMFATSFERAKERGEPHLGVEDLRVIDERGLPALQGLSFEVHAGEIVGIAGVQGNGQSELAEAIAGVRPSEGTIQIVGEEVGGYSLRKRREKGLAVIPENRKEQGLNLQASIATNVVAADYYHAPYSHRGVLDNDAILRLGRDVVDRFQIQAPDEKVAVAKLSGGNQQKVVVGRELSKTPQILLAAYATRGLDVAAAKFVREEIVRMRDEGVAVLFISADLDEIFRISDRILVLFEGQLVGERLPDETSYEEIGLLMTGEKSD